jgi:hypothetical protein
MTQERAFACPVGADQADDTAGVNTQVHSIKGFSPAEPFGNIV